MRIESYNQIQQLYQAKSLNTTEKTKQASKRDQLEISSLGKDIQTLKTALKNTPDVREDLVISIKEQVEKGNYEVSSISFAEKLISQL